MSTEEPAASQESRAQVRQMLLIGAVASAFGIALALLIDWFPAAASTQAKTIDTLWDVLLIASVPIFVLVETIVLYSALKFRMKPGEELKDGPPIHGNTKLEIIWTAIPAIILVGLCTYAYVALVDIEKAEANTMEVRVVGEQFTWTFFYPGEGGKEIQSSQLYLPGEHGGALHGPVQGRDPRLLGAGLPDEDRRGAGDRHPPARDDHGPHGRVPGRVRGAVRARALDDAPERARDEPGGLRQEDRRARQAAGARGRGRRWRRGGRDRRQDPVHGGRRADVRARATRCRTPARPAPPGPNLDEVLPDLSEAQIRQSIEDPDAKSSRRASSPASCRDTVRPCPRSRSTRWCST